MRLISASKLACYLTALHFANLVYDRWLIDDTRSLASAIRSENGETQFDVPRGALQIFQSTQNPDGSPTSTRRTPGVGMSAAVECVPPQSEVTKPV